MTLLGVAIAAASGRAFFVCVCGGVYSFFCMALCRVFLPVGIAMCRVLLYVVGDKKYT